MKALILLGGLGTRLRPFTLDTPKPLLPILNRPFLSYQLAQLKRYGVREVVLALGYQARYFRRHLGSGAAWGVRFRYSLERSPLGTGGAIRKALPYLDGTTFVLNGDALSDVDLGKLHRFHRRHNAHGTLALAKVQDPTAFGLIETDRSGRIRRFLEKPKPQQVTVNTINAGFYVFEHELIRSIPAGRSVSIERDIFPARLKQGYRFAGYVHRGYWSDIGTLKSYWQTHMDLLGKAKRPVLLGKGCRVGAGATFRGRVCVGKGCVIGAGAALSDCVIHDNSRIGAQARVEGALVGARCRIGDLCQVGPGVALANRSALGPYSGPIPGLRKL